MSKNFVRKYQTDFGSYFYLRTMAESAKVVLQLDPPRNFLFQAKDWAAWKTHFKRYWTASGLAEFSDDEQVNALIYIKGLKTEEIFKAFVYDKPGDGKMYDKVLAKFDAHFIPRKNVIHEWYIFYTRNQCKEQQKNFLLRFFHPLAETCEFDTFKDQMIRDRIVVGTSNRSRSQ